MSTSTVSLKTDIKLELRSAREIIITITQANRYAGSLRTTCLAVKQLLHYLSETPYLITGLDGVHNHFEDWPVVAREDTLVITINDTEYTLDKTAALDVLSI